ncbi:TraU protein [Vibrio thalassae]|uniref:TraU protein n=1 Tax=Vibrio thalassae TaxID=1243014 RepID=A0A240EG52_9VIBR|nr:hypothetical protein [Vibrio thalassae]SNX47253.1 TraU protein [Vibrio thalassae]
MVREWRTALLVWSVSFYAYAQAPSADQVSEISKGIDLAESFSNWKSAAMSTLGLSQQGIGGTSKAPDAVNDDGSFLNSLGGITDKLEQRDAWTLTEEYTYSLEHDYGDFGALFNCMEYSIVGYCLSVRWTWLGPVFTPGIAVEHFVRDVHTEVVPQSPPDPLTSVPDDTVLPSSNSAVEDIAMMYPYMWKLNRTLGSSLLTQAIPDGLTDAVGQTVATRKTNYLYNDALVSGNIERNMFDAVAGAFIGVVGYCNSPTLPGVSYFSSSLDQFSWRWLATSETILLGLYQAKYLAWNDIGRGYGSTMPRVGYVDTINRWHASITSAIRATSIAAENRALFSGLAGLHIYVPLPQYASSSFTGSNYQTPQDVKSFKIDMVYPYKGERCTRYNTNDRNALMPLTLSEQMEEDKLTAKFSEKNGNNAAIYKIYRPFRCCRKSGSKVFDVVSPGPIGQPK